MSITRLNSHHKLFISFGISLIAFLLTRGKFTSSIEFMVIWLVYALSQIALSWITIFSIHPIEMQKIAKDQDTSRTLIFVFVLGAALVSLGVVLLLLRSAADSKGSELITHVMFSIVSVISSWVLVHTLFVFRYAHLYYDEPKKKTKSSSKYVEGLEFPDEKEPDYLDFMYFSFVIGMTFQVSDVEISSRRIRRLALLHSLIAFIFNTVIVALSINIISSLMQK